MRTRWCEGWSDCSNYLIKFEVERFKVTVEDKDGKEFKVRMERHCLHLLRHDLVEPLVEANEGASDDEARRNLQEVVVTIKFYKHVGKWIWGDSRFPGSITFENVVREVARMLFDEDYEAAKQFMVAKFPIDDDGLPDQSLYEDPIEYWLRGAVGDDGEDFQFQHEGQDYIIRDGQVYDSGNMFVGTKRSHELLDAMRSSV